MMLSRFVRCRLANPGKYHYFSGSGPCRTFVPKEIYQRFPPELQLLYRHLAEVKNCDFLIHFESF